jgi:hypothetical protein
MDELTAGLLNQIFGDRLLIGQPEARRALGMSKPTMDGEIEAGRLEYVLVGKRRKFLRVDLSNYIEKLRSRREQWFFPVRHPFELNPDRRL